MKTSSFTVIVSSIALAIVGCALIPLLPVKLAPSQRLPSLTVSFAMPGNSARTVEGEVTSRLESILARVSGVKDIDSRSSTGAGSVTISLDRHADIENTRFEVSAFVRQAWNDMPDGVTYPEITLQAAQTDGERPFMTLTLNAPGSPSEIQAYAEENLKPLLSQIDGVSKVNLSGGQPMQWRLRCDIDRLNALGLTPADIQRAISEHHSSEFLGIASIQESDGKQWLRLSMQSAGSWGGFSPQEIALRTPSGKAVSLDKLVTVTHEEATPAGYFRINGLNSVYVNISSDEFANQLDLAKEIKAALKAFEHSMPQGYMIETVYDATEEISSELDKIYFRTALTVLILLLFVGIVSLSLRYVLLISIGLAINLAVAVVFYYLSGIEIQLYSLAGITISLNLVIDNLIVMADHYTRRRNLGAFTAILAATLTTIGALSIVFFMDERTRLSLQDFVNVVIINLAVSLAVALFLVPALVVRLGIHHKRSDGKLMRRRRLFALRLSKIYDRCVRFIVKRRALFIIAAVLAFGLPVFLIPEKIDGESYFAGKYNEIFDTQVFREKIKPVINVALGGTLRLFVEKVYNGTYWDREPGEPVLSINATLPNGATLVQMNTLVKKMEQYLGSFPQIRQYQTLIMSPRRASINVMFEKEHQRNGFPYRLKSEVVSKALTLGGGSWSVYGLEDQGFNNDVRETAGSFGVQLSGYDYDELSNWAYRMRDTLLTHRRIQSVTVASQFSYWKDDYTEYHLAIDHDKLAMHGITAIDLYSAIAPAIGRDISCGLVMTGDRAENVILYSVQGDEYDIFTLMHQPFTVGNHTFNLSDIGSIEKRQAPQDIIKKNQEYLLCLQYDYIGSRTQGDALLKKDLATINSLMPVGYRAEAKNYQWSRGDNSSKYWLLALVIAIIFFTTAILFNSLSRPFAIILIIPVSFIGVFSIFYLMKLNFDQGGFASFILLAGITVNAAIYLLNEYNSLRRQYAHQSARKLYIRALRIKIVPILLTVLSTLLGFIPFIIGETKESFWFPLAIGTMGGLAMSLVALLFIFPIFVLPKEK